MSSVCITGLLVAAAWSVQLARAEAAFRAGTPEGVARAISLAPGNTEYLALGALQASYDGQDAGAQWRHIAELNPRSSPPRISLGLAAEQKGLLDVAEKWLLDAYAVDHQFESRWTLTNFYFRQERETEFWAWMRSALEVSYGDRRPAFELCWRMTTNPEPILRAIPERVEVAEAYLTFVLSRPEALAGAARRVRQTELLLAATDALLDAGRYADAVEVWRQAEFPAPRGVMGFGIAEGHGFGWRWSRAVGVRHRSPARVELTGDQLEVVELARIYVGGLTPGGRYRLRWEAENAPLGLVWRTDGQTAAEFLAAKEFALLTLSYERPRGEKRAEGTFEIRTVELLLQ